MLRDLIFKEKRSSQPAVFSILIPSWNNLPYLQLCIKSILKNSAYKHQIIVHVNDGSDGTLEWIKTQTEIDYTHSAENIGVCYPLNIGRSLVTTDYVVYLNDDMYLCPGWDVAFMEEINAVGHNYFFFSATAIQPHVFNDCMIEKNYGNDTETFREQDLLNEFASLQLSDWQGSTWPPNIVHRDIWDLAGGYSIEFSPGMYSDPDFSMKLWVMGVRLFKGISRSRAYHFGSKSTPRIIKNSGYYTFIAKWGTVNSTFTKHMLHSGKPFNGALPEFKPTLYIKLKNLFKRIGLLFKMPL